jgi:hypothetical protein
MTADNVTSIEHEAQPSANPAEAAALVQGGVAALLASGQAMLNGGQAMHGALLAFLQSRAKDGLAVGQQLAACRSPEAVLEVQLEYGKAMLQAYTDEFGRLHALTGRILADVLVPLRRGAVAAPEASAERRSDALAA